MFRLQRNDKKQPDGTKRILCCILVIFNVKALSCPAGILTTLNYYKISYKLVKKGKIGYPDIN